MTHYKLHPTAFGLSIGIVWGLSVFVTGILALFFTYGMPFVVAMSNIYIGYEASFIGSLIGGAFGFVDGFIGGAIIAWLYNYLTKKCSSCGAIYCCDDTVPTSKTTQKKHPHTKK